VSFPAFARLLRRQLKERDISIREVCRYARIDPSYMAKVLRGERNPPDDERVLFRLSEILRVDPLRLFISVGRIPSAWQTALDDDDRLLRLRRLMGDVFPLPPSAGPSPAPVRKSPETPAARDVEERETPKRSSPFFESEMSEDLL